MSVMRIGPIAVNRGSRGYGVLVAGRLADGQELAIPVHVIAGSRDGPVLTVVATQHGDEVGPLAALRELLSRLDPRKVAGTIIVVPVANPLAFDMGVRSTWFDALYHGTTGNLNRLWPGKADGFLTERMAYVLSESVIQPADCVVDLHGSTMNSISIYYSFVHVEGTPLGRQARELALSFGMEILVRWPEYPGRTLVDYVYTDLGKAVVAAELGTFHGLAREVGETKPSLPVRSAAEVGVTGITNVMKTLGMLQGKPKLPSVQVVISPETRCLPPIGGLLIPEVGVRDIGSILLRGHVLGRIIDAVTFDEVASIEAPYAQNLLLSARDIWPLSKVNPGDQAFHVADVSTAEWIVNEPRT